MFEQIKKIWVFGVLGGGFEENLIKIIPILKHLPGIEQVAAFGDSLHVSGKDGDAIKKSMMNEELKEYRCSEIDPSLEDVFINLSDGRIKR